MAQASVPTDARVAPLLAQAARLRQAGQLAQSLAPMREAARLAPDNFAVQHDLGLACLQASRPADAAAALKRAVALDPGVARAFWRLGIALQQQGDVSEALRAYRQAVTLMPSLADAQYSLATLLEHLGHRSEAIGHYRRAAASAPKTTLGRLASAHALRAEDRDGDAERVLRQLLALDSTNANAHEMLGHILADAGRFDAARESYERAVVEAPQRAGNYYDLARCRRLTDADAGLVGRMQAALGQPGMEAAHRLRLLLALGKAADDLGDYAQAMQYFDAADAVRHGLADFDLGRFEARVDALIDRFTPALIARATQFGSADPAPVLILGMPRSGTTLVEQIVSSHQHVAAGGELHFWTRRGGMMEQAGEAGSEAGFLAAAATDCLRLLRTIGPRAARITDKMPSNFLWAGLVHLVFPQAVIIHCRRSPIDTVLSIHQTHFNPRLGFPTGGAELVGYYRAYERLMEHWRRVLPPERFIEVEYEALTEAPEPETRRIIAATGLPWDDACLHPERNERVVRTASKWQARQPIYRTAVERWRRYEPYLGPLAALVPQLPG